MAHAYTRGGRGGLSAVVDDPTPQLGGDLDADGHSIASLSLLNARDPDKLLYQKGDPSWANRTHEGSEIFDTAHTYTIGTGGDYATLADAAAALQGLILIADLTLQLQEDITLTSDVLFKGLIGMGGKFIIDLNSHVINISDGCSGGIQGTGSFEFMFRDVATGGSIKMVATSLKPPYYMICANSNCLLNLDQITLDANSKAFIAAVRIFKSRGRLFNCTYSNGTSLNFGFIYATETSHAGFTAVDASCKADRGSIIIKSDGTVVTT